MKRPAAATTFGILNIIFAGVGMLGIAATVAMLSARGGAPNPVLTMMRQNSTYAGWMKLSLPLGVLACAALLAAGIGLLRMKSWARTLSIGYAIYAILLGLLGTAINFLFLVKPMLEEAANRQGPEAAAMMGGAIGGSVGGCLGLIYPILLLIFMTRPKLAAAFRSDGEPPVIVPPAS